MRSPRCCLRALRSTAFAVIALSALSAIALSGCVSTSGSGSVSPRSSDIYSSGTAAPPSRHDEEDSFTRQAVDAVLRGSDAANTGTTPTTSAPCVSPAVTGQAKVQAANVGRSGNVQFYTIADRKYVMKDSRTGNGEFHEDFRKHIKSTLPPELLNISGAKMRDTGSCSKYPSFNEEQKRTFWSDFIEAISKVESGHRINEAFPERAQSRSTIESGVNWSEGLLQISYSDTKNNGCTGIDWNADKDKIPAEVRSMNQGTRSDRDWDLALSRAPHIRSSAVDRTILNPFVNLSCGMQIMKNQMKLHPEETLMQSVYHYWSVTRKYKTERRGLATIFYVLDKPDPSYIKFRNELNRNLSRDHVPCVYN